MTKFSWKKFFYVGKHLINHSDNEEYQRSAVGRFYYACFGLTKNYYENTHNKIIPRKDSHENLIKKLEDSCYDEENELGELLKDLRRYRNQADYSDTFNLKNVRNSEKRSTALMDLIESLKQNPVVPKF